MGLTGERAETDSDIMLPAATTEIEQGRDYSRPLR